MVRAMAKERTSGPNGVGVELILHFSNLLGNEYITLFKHAISLGSLPPGMIRGLISLMFKIKDRLELDN